LRRVRAEVLSTRRLGTFHVITLVAPEIAERARPGQFLAVAMPEDREFILRRNFAIHQASRRGGWAGTLEFAFEVHGPGTQQLSRVKAHETLEVLGPLGKAFAYPKLLTNCLLVAEGHGAAPLYFLAQELRARHKRVDLILGGETLERVFKPIEAKRLSQTISIASLDGTIGDRGTVLDPLASMADRCRSEVLYAAGPAETLRRITAFCFERSLPAQVLIEERMACATGLCFSCVVPVARKDGSGYDNLRACVDGPIFNPARVLWDRWRTDREVVPRPSLAVRSWPG
jgi:dihydroorotate dehydrogenase electron transfer subunit